MNFSQRNFPWVSKDVASRIQARTSARRILRNLPNTTSVMYKPSNVEFAANRWAGISFAVAGVGKRNETSFAYSLTLCEPLKRTEEYFPLPTTIFSRFLAVVILPRSFTFPTIRVAIFLVGTLYLVEQSRVV